MNVARTLGVKSPTLPPFIDGFRTARFLPIDTNPWFVEFVQQPVGKAILSVLFALALAPINVARSLPITAAAAACAYAGRYRNAVRTLATLSLVFGHANWFDLYWPAEIAPRAGLAGRLDVAFALWPMLFVLFLLSAGAMLFVRRFRATPLGRHPLLCQLIFFACLLGVACSGTLAPRLQARLWTFIAVFGAYFWFLSYALADQKARDGNGPLIQFGVFHPFWGSSTTPIGKGAAYLRKVEAKNSRDLAVTQLKGLKLLLWVLVLTVLMEGFDYVSHSLLHVPVLADALDRHMAGRSYPWYVCWASLIQNFFHNMLDMATWGGAIVAVARFAGYRLLRNTRRPLTSTTLVEFWNRYYFYYKELLVDMFFFPTFFTCFKAHGQVRIFFATVMAASVGNFIFHFMRDIAITEQFGFVHQLRGFQTFAFYCVALGLGIGISQLRIHRRASSRLTAIRQSAAIMGVLGYYCVLSIFSQTYSEYSLSDHLSFLLHAVGISPWNSTNG